MRRRGFTLIEGVVAIVVLSIAVPISMAMMVDAASARAASLQRERAALLASVVRTEIIADMASPSDGLGLILLDDPEDYDDVLRPRIEELTRPYEDAGLSWSIDVGPYVSANGGVSVQPELNIYRPVTLTIAWNDARSGPRALDLEFFVAEVGG